MTTSNKSPPRRGFKDAMERKKIRQIVEIEDPLNYKKRFVNNREYISLKIARYFVGNPFGGYNIGVKPMKTGRLDVWFDDPFIGHFDDETLLPVPENMDTLIKR